MPSALIPNEELLIKVLVQIEKHPETWNQSFWAVSMNKDRQCGTAFCIAGHAAVLSGFEPNWVRSDLVSSAGDLEKWNYCASGVANSFDQYPRHIRGVAAQLLGLNSLDSKVLFNGTNTRDDVFRISAEILNLDQQVLEDKVASIAAEGDLQDA